MKQRTLGWLSAVTLAATTLFATPAVAAPCILAACKAMTTEFRDRELRPQTIAVLPPHSTLRKKNVIGSEDMVGESEGLEAALGDALEARLSKLGYHVSRVTIAQLDADPRLAHMVAAAEKRYDEERKNILEKFKDVKYRRYSVGDMMRVLAAYIGVEAVAFTRMEAVGATGAAILFSPTGGGDIYMDISIAHVRTGDIEAFFGATNTGGLFGKSLSSILEHPDKHVAKVIKKATKGLPPFGKELAVENLDPERVRAPLLHDSAADESELLSELEGLVEDLGATSGGN